MLLLATQVMALATGVVALMWGAYFALRLIHAVGLASTDIGDIRFENEQVLGFGFLLVVLACLTLVLQRTRLAIARQADELTQA